MKSVALTRFQRRAQIGRGVDDATGKWGATVPWAIAAAVWCWWRNAGGKEVTAGLSLALELCGNLQKRNWKAASSSLQLVCAAALCSAQFSVYCVTWVT